ncbi:MAG: sulfotransferase [Alphaproteobacteria bacterium]
MKIFQIGFNKCGTTSLWRHFAEHGLKTVHHDNGQLALTIKRNLDSGAPILKGYEDYDFFSDMIYLSDKTHIEACKFHKELCEQVPGSRFILNTRNKDRWLKSRLEHGDMAERCRNVYGYKTLDEVVDRWSRDWDEHHAAVMQDIPADRLIVFNIETDDISDVDRFLGLAPRSVSGTLPHVGWTRSALDTTLRKITPAQIKKRLSADFKERVSYFLRVRR